jgi:aspartyl/asparaginyl beta-hydroxylase (cupin superfamily)/thioredoxin-like negative regulator of GroEL
VQVQQIVYAAQQAMQVGRPEEAARLWAQVLTLSPEHPQALFHLGQHRLMQKDAAGALSLLEGAAKADPKAPVIPLNIAFAHRAQGDVTAEIAALDRALTIDPYFYPALLAKGTALERLGQKRQAAKIYKDVLSIVPSEEDAAPGLRDSLQHAREVVKQNAAELGASLDRRLGRLREKHAGEDLARFEQATQVAAGLKKIYVQKPVMLHYPALPAVQFYDRELFPWLAQLEAATPAIRDEFLRVFGQDNADFEPYVNYPAGVPVNQWAELNRSPRWSALHFWRDGKRMDDVCARCPATAAAVKAVPKAEIPNFSPNVLYSLLAPHTQIPPHTSSTNIRLIVHLPLIVPGSCRFRVGNDPREWEEGRAWVFDDTIDHEAWNDSDHLRVILMIDVWNPFLSAAEREMVSVLLNEVRNYYAGSPSR